MVVTFHDYKIMCPSTFLYSLHTFSQNIYQLFIIPANYITSAVISRNKTIVHRKMIKFPVYKLPREVMLKPQRKKESLQQRTTTRVLHFGRQVYSLHINLTPIHFGNIRLFFLIILIFFSTSSDSLYLSHLRPGITIFAMYLLFCSCCLLCCVCVIVFLFCYLKIFS